MVKTRVRCFVQLLQCALFLMPFLDLTRGLSFQILIELETALLDDEPHWYKLQTHDESSLPLPQPSPFMPRRHTHGESASKKLQSRWTLCSVARSNCVVRSEFHIDVRGIFSNVH